jgi:hypothetical protein
VERFGWHALSMDAKGVATCSFTPFGVPQGVPPWIAMEQTENYLAIPLVDR